MRSSTTTSASVIATGSSEHMLQSNWNLVEGAAELRQIDYAKVPKGVCLNRAPQVRVLGSSGGGRGKPATLATAQAAIDPSTQGSGAWIDQKSAPPAAPTASAARKRRSVSTPLGDKGESQGDHADQGHDDADRGVLPGDAPIAQSIVPEEQREVGR